MHDPRVPETLEGWSVLHQMFRVRWNEWTALDPADREKRANEAARALAEMQRGAAGTSVPVTMLGHKGDLLLIHFRKGFEALQAAQLDVSRLAIAPFLEATTSFVSVVELGMYEMTGRIHQRLADEGLKTGTEEFEKAFDAALAEQEKRVAGRLWLDVPARRYVCFYPMNKHRGETKNWYAEPFDFRARMMREHGRIGRQYAGRVNQIMREAQSAQPGPHGVRVLYATQGAVDPPTFTLFANKTVPPTYLRYLERQLREAAGLDATPIKMRVRQR